MAAEEIAREPVKHDGLDRRFQMSLQGGYVQWYANDDTVIRYSQERAAVLAAHLMMFVDPKLVDAAIKKLSSDMFGNTLPLI